MQNIRITLWHSKYAVGIAVLISLYTLAYAYVTPQFTNGSFILPDPGITETFTYPLHSKHQGRIEGQMQMTVGTVYPNIYQIVPDNCLTRLAINTVEVPTQKLTCDWKYGTLIDLGPYIQSGSNTIDFTLTNSGGYGGLQIHPSFWDQKIITMHVIFITLLLLAIWLWVKNILFKIDRAVVATVLFGVLLRAYYYMSTPFGIRSYDTYGHIEYIVYVLEHWKMPLVSEGWQFYQPPLYYFLTAVILLPGKLLDLNTTALLNIAQSLSFVLATVSLIIGAWVSYILFPKNIDTTKRVLFTAVIAVLPGLVFSASRISNDTMLLPIWFALFGFYVRFWRYKKPSDWYYVVLFFSAATLIKWNSLALAPLLAGSLVIAYYRHWRTLVKISLYSLCIIGILAGWLFAVRFLVQEQVHIVGNIENNSPQLFTQEWSPWNLVTLKPIELLRYPFNSSWDDTYGRGYFWLYMPKSVFTGEWNFGIQVNTILRFVHFINILLIAAAFIEMLRDMWRNRLKNLPLWGTIFTMIFACWLLQLNKHNGGLQDFRYLTIIALPVTYYVLQATTKTRILRKEIQGLLIAFIALTFIVNLLIIRFG